MGYNKSPLAFADVQEAFDKALLSSNGVKIPCDSHGAAINLRSRFNYYRTINREENAKTYEPDHPMHNRSVYDKLLLRVARKGHPNDAYLFIEHLQPLTIEEISDVPA